MSGSEEIGIVTCRCVGTFERALTYARKYAVHATNADNVRVRGDNGRLRWFPRYCFDLAGGDLPVVTQLKIDDTLRSETPVEVTLRWSDGQVRWCLFAAPAMLAACGDIVPGTDARVHYGCQIIVLSILTRESIEAAVRYIQNQGELIAHTLPLEMDPP